jgi:uncharacterized protein (DUF2336 family)
VSFSDFRHIGDGGDKQDRLLRAAISAFCSIPRPSRREIAQIEDLAVPLLDSTTPETRRYVAAALSECRYPPADLILRLTREPVEICAPLLVRSEALSEVDLISLIARHGMPYARAIARRPKLSPKVAALIEKLAKSGGDTVLQEVAPRLVNPADPSVDEKAPIVPIRQAQAGPGAAAEEVRRKLREMVREHAERLEKHGQDAPRHQIAQQTYQKLKATALTGAGFFQTALADALGISFAKARSITDAQNYTDLMLSLRALDLDETQAFLLVSATFPSTFNHSEAIRLFVERYQLLRHDVAREQVRRWVLASAGNDVADNHARGFGADARFGAADTSKRRVMRSR